MNKKNLLFYLVLVLCLCPFFRGIADEFEDYIQSCAIISKNFRTAVKARGSRYGQEYVMYLKTMLRQAEKIQQCIRHLQLGNDFDFSGLTREIEKIYYEDKNARIGKNRSVSVDPSGILDVLRFDVEELHRMEFTSEEGGSINPSLERKRKLLEMSRLIRFFQKFRFRVLRNNQDASLRNVFESRCRKMLPLAQELDLLIRRRHPGAASAAEYNLDREVRSLLICYEKMMDNARRQHSASSASRKKGSSHRTRSGRKKTSSVHRLRDSETPQALEQNTRIAIRNIHRTLAQLENANFLSDSPVKSAGGSLKNGSSPADPAEVLRSRNAAPDYESRSAKELHTMLLALRKQILKGNTSMDGFDSVTERKYVQTLSREQTRIYREALKKLKDQGFEPEIAVRNAVLKTQLEISIARELPPKKELVRILERIRKEEIRSRGKVNF